MLDVFFGATPSEQSTVFIQNHSALQILGQNLIPRHPSDSFNGPFRAKEEN
jgi:hypothetical protein